MGNIVISIVTGYLVIMSIIGFAMMGIDKHRAIKKAWRIPERTLFMVAFLGGGIGVFIGMHTFHHKTKHIKFIVLFPFAAILYILLLLKLYNIL